MKIREHRGSLDESMKTVREVHTFDELLREIRESLNIEIGPEQVLILPYIYDKRVEWNTHLITLDGLGVWGMADGPATPEFMTPQEAAAPTNDSSSN